MLRNNNEDNKNFPVSLLLDNVRSALNVGAIFRTCDATNINKLYLGGITPYPPHNKIPKTALGSIDMVSWEHTETPIQKIQELKATGNKIVSIEIAKNSKDIFQYKFHFPSVIILGHEISGVSEQAQELSDDIVHIPMYGDKESLNVATATGIVLYEAIRQYYYND